MMTADSSGQSIFRHFDESSGLPNTNIHSIIEDCNHTIWAGTSNGISGIRHGGSDFVSIFYEDGLLNNEFSDGAGYSDRESGKLFFGCVDGVNVISPELLPAKDWMPNLILHKALLDKTPCRLMDSSIIAGYRTGVIELDFSIPDYLDGRKCSLAYSLAKGTRHQTANVNTADWINIGSGRTVVLSGLSPGHYTLTARCSNSMQSWSTAQTYHITIRHPAMLQPWLIILYIISACFVTFSLFRLIRTRKAARDELEKERRMYRQTVELMKLRNAEAAHSQTSEALQIPECGIELWDRQEKDFMRKVMDALEKNCGNEDYNQDALASDLAVSRAQLYRKIRQILDTTPGDFIRRFRMRKAEQLLTGTSLTVQEIMYDCGFRNKSYFYREFGRLHNCSPKDFRHHSQI